MEASFKRTTASFLADDPRSGNPVEFPFDQDREFQKVLHDRAPVDLVRLLAEFSRDAQPDLDVERCVRRVQQLGEEARQAVETDLAPSASVRQRLERISRFLYQEQGFRGNEGSYYDARNSYVQEILERRTGIPITLAILYISVCKSAGVPTCGVKAPAHFVVGAMDGPSPLYVDAFHGGQVLTREECRQRIGAMLGQAVPDKVLREAHDHDIAVRVLRNLKAAHLGAEEFRSALPVQQRLALLLQDEPQEQRDLGVLHLHCGQPQRALALFELYLEQCTPAQRQQLDQMLSWARQMVSELN